VARVLSTDSRRVYRVLVSLSVGTPLMYNPAAPSLVSLNALPHYFQYTLILVTMLIF
jgi:hypothetical protein